MTMTRGHFWKTIIPGYKNVVMLEFKERPVEGSKLVNMMTESDRAYIEFVQLAGLGPMYVKGESGEVTFDEGMQGGTKRYTFTTWALAFRISEEWYDDDLYSITGNQFAKSLAKSARNNKEIIMHAPYNNAFNTAYSGYTASKSLCSTSQTGIKGSTFSNRPATDADFSLLSFQAAVEHFSNLTDEEGMPCMIRPKMVLHSVGDNWIVQQVLKSTQLPGGNQNDINVASQLGINSAIAGGSHYLTDTDSWFLIGDEHQVDYISRKPFKFGGSEHWASGDALFKGQQRHTSGFRGWRGVYGTSGG